MADPSNPLSAFLRARRDAITPEQAGIPRMEPRRVPGLRREEVAMLAGISNEYYLRLEQGRYRRPSAQVLDALAQALRLDPDSATYLRDIAREETPARRRRRKPETLPPGLVQLVNAMPMPAFIEGRHLDVLAANPMAELISPCLKVGRNRLRDVLLDPDERDLFIDWEPATEGIVASFRQSIGSDVDDTRAVELVGQLSLASPRFRTLWARHDIGGRRGALIRLQHPLVGEIHLNREKLVPAEAPHLTVAIYHATPSTTDADKLTLLAAHLPSTDTVDQSTTSHTR